MTQDLLQGPEQLTPGVHDVVVREWVVKTKITTCDIHSTIQHWPTIGSYRTELDQRNLQDDITAAAAQW